MDGICLIAFLNLITWLYLFSAHGHFWQLLFLEPLRNPLSAWPQVVVVIPARNETDMLSQTLPSLLTHDYPDLQIVVVDDHSEDGTADIAQRIAEESGASTGLTVIQSQKLPGWKGKVSAMQSGLSYLGASKNPPCYVLFTDADIAYDKGVIHRLVAKAETNGNVLTSLMVKLRCKSVAEQWLVPAFVYFFQLIYPFRRINDPKNKTAGAAGGCMLVRYDALIKAGGLTPIHSALIDDCALGKVLKQQGPIWLGLTDEVHSLRAYPEFNDIRMMVARTAYDQLRYSPLLLGLSILGMVFLYVLPIFFTFTNVGVAGLLGLLSWLLMSITYVPMIRFYRLPIWQSLMLPLTAVCYMGFTLDSAWQYSQGRGGFWKGRAQAV